MRLAVAIVVLFAVVGSSYPAYRFVEKDSPAISVSQDQRTSIAFAKATCPFIGSVVNGGFLPIHGDLNAPLGLVSDIVALGNSGGGTLGWVLKLFTTGNHAKMPTQFVNPVPLGTFSLDFPGSQGAHPGHSGILMSDWRKPNSGRFDEVAFHRMTSYSTDGYLTYEMIGDFIAQNCKNDPAAKLTFKNHGLLRLIADSVGVLQDLGKAIMAYVTKGPNNSEQDERNAVTALTKTLGEDNLVGSAGEFALLWGLLENSPLTRRSDMALSIQDVTSLFVGHQFPSGWLTWKKNALTWAVASGKITAHAIRASL